MNTTETTGQKMCVKNENGKRIRGHLPKHVENYEMPLPDGVFDLRYRWTLGGVVRRERVMRRPIHGRIYGR